jgi:hypothetical protein
MYTGSDFVEITIVTIATGKYWEYFLQMLGELDLLLPGRYPYQVIVYEDNDLEVPDGITPSRCELIRLKSSYGIEWKLVTLKRYEEIYRARDEIRGERLLWLDADSAWLKPFDLSLLDTDVRLTLHPDCQIGVFNSRADQNFTFIERLKILLSCLKKRQVGVGLWSEIKEAKFYVPKWRRRHYAHSAIWGGPTNKVINLCAELAARVELDLIAGHIDTWMDEAYINWWAANREFRWFPKTLEGYFSSLDSSSKKSVFFSLDKVAMDKRENPTDRILK